MLLARLAGPFVVASAVLACAPARPPLTGPASGGPAWHELVSEHVALETDVPLEEARRRLTQFEAMHAALVAAIGIDAPPRAPRVEVVLFDRTADFFAVAGETKTKDAYFAEQAPGDLEPRPLMVMHEEDLDESARHTFQHELAHRLLHTRYPSLPPWLNEGLAKYYETIEVRPEGILVGDAGRVDFWPRPYAAYTWLGNEHQLNLPIAKAPALAELVADDRDGFYAATARGAGVSEGDRERQTANYAAAWRVVHYLLDEAAPADRARFAAAMAGFSRGERQAFDAQFRAELPRLQAELSAFLTRSVRRSWLRVPLPAPTAAPRDRLLAEAEVHLLWSRLLKPTDDRAGGEVIAALTADPASPEPHYQRAVVMLKSHLEDGAAVELRQALAARPHEPRYLFAELVLLERQRRPIPVELVDELARTAVSANQLQAAARCVGERRLVDGLLLAARSVAADPFCWRCQLTRAALLSRGGANDDALVALDRAIALMPEGAPVDELQKARRELAQAAGGAVTAR